MTADHRNPGVEEASTEVQETRRIFLILSSLELL
jgi:hypothetical protein